MRANQEHRRAERRARAIERQAARDARTAADQWRALDGRPGASKRERIRLHNAMARSGENPLDIAEARATFAAEVCGAPRRDIAAHVLSETNESADALVADAAQAVHHA